MCARNLKYCSAIWCFTGLCDSFLCIINKMHNIYDKENNI
ncbi:hypothetical protein HMPREF0208_00634 [Citrobacter koseri]|nr:hypothetical protein HMPREF0208_00634 [Citrobacter koseri]